MDALAIVKKFSIGNSVAEFDDDLENYFVETETFRAVIEDRGDVIAGDKGTGKTAIYKVLKRSYRAYDELEAVEMVDAFNVQGNPIFQRLLQGPLLTEGQYRTFWKAYIFSLLGNYLIDIYGATFNTQMRELKNTLDYLGLSSPDTTPSTIFGKLYNLVNRVATPTAMETEFSLTETGLPVVTPRVEFGPEQKAGSEIYSDTFLSTLEDASASTSLRYWVLFDRLDEAFTGSPEIEIPALRALMRTYLDLSGLKSVRLKLFVRKDLFRRIIQGGFVNLTHINARRIDIIWDDDDLINMITRRLRGNVDLVETCELEGQTDQEVMGKMLPEQIDVGDRKPATRTWIMGRIRDGNDAKPPRNLIDLLNKAKEAQARKDAREQREIDPVVGPVIEASSVKRAFSQLSEQRVQDTLLAESNELTKVIELFRDGKSEHNISTLTDIISPVANARDTVQGLLDAGFLEQFGENFKIPQLYRDGLKITQGKAF